MHLATVCTEITVIGNSSRTNRWWFRTKRDCFLCCRFVRFSSSCQDMWQGLYWVGARGDLATRQWLTLGDRQPLTWHNLSLTSSSVTEQYQCILAGGARHPYEWYHAPCSVSTCAVCNFTSYPLIHMRGLCRSSLFDRSMYIHEYLNDQPMFDGAVHSRVAWVDDAWVIESRLYPKLRARILEDVEYPLGLHEWEVEGDKCRHKKVRLSAAMSLRCNRTYV